MSAENTLNAESLGFARLPEPDQSLASQLFTLSSSIHKEERDSMEAALRQEGTCPGAAATAPYVTNLQRG